jgi:hypothetical protein
MRIPEKYEKWLTLRAWFNCLRVAVALFVIAWLFEFAHAVVFSEVASTWLKSLYLIGMAFLFSLILWLLSLISPEVIETVFSMLGFEEKEKDDKGDKAEKAKSESVGTHAGDSGKWDKIAVTISIVSLIASIVFSNYSFTLASQANELTKKSLELQNILSNFTSIIVPNPERGFLNEGGYYFNGTTSSSNPKGWLNVSLTVITPHYGNVSVEIMNFSVSDYFNMLIPEKANLTTVSYTPEYQYSKHVGYVVSGLNQLSFSLNLEATVYPNPQKLPSTSPSESEFPIGVLFLQAKLFDAQTDLTITQDFSTIIFVTIKTL